MFTNIIFNEKIFFKSLQAVFKKNESNYSVVIIQIIIKTKKQKLVAKKTSKYFMQEKQTFSTLLALKLACFANSQSINSSFFHI